MPTRQGWTILVAAVAALAVGRVFGILELFVIGAALAAAVALAVVTVRAHPPELRIHRWIHPSTLTVGDTGRVDLLIENGGRWRSPRSTLTEAVGEHNSAKVELAGIPAGEQVTAGYRVPAARRGTLTVGPTLLERRDLLGLASTNRIGAAATDVTVAPQTFDLPMPSLGHGVLGRHLLALAQRTGVGEFHSLRDYVAGDEPRTIHWRASARSTELKVRQHEAQGVRRCIVLLDSDARSFTDPAGDDGDAFERAISIAASVALGADRSGLTTRFVTGHGIDLRGPEVTAHMLHHLARIEPGGPLGDIDRDPGEGLGLVIVVTGRPDAELWRRSERAGDPTLTRIGIFTSPRHGRGAGPLTVDASTIAEFREHWLHLAGQRGLTRELHTTGART